LGGFNFSKKSRQKRRQAEFQLSKHQDFCYRYVLKMLHIAGLFDYLYHKDGFPFDQVFDWRVLTSLKNGVFPFFTQVLRVDFAPETVCRL
jgi:hypothetical protein